MSSDEELLDPSFSSSTPIIKRKRTVVPRAKAKKLARPRAESSDGSNIEDSDDESLGLDVDSDDEILAAPSKSKAKAKSSKGKVVRAKAKTKAKAKTTTKKRAASTGSGAAGSGGVKSKKPKGDTTGDDDDAAPATNLHHRKPGQKFHIPSNGDGIRVFYESLYEQNRDDYIAIKYMVEYGCLELGSAALDEAYEKYCFLKQEGAFKRLGGIRRELDPTLLEVRARYDCKKVPTKSGIGTVKKESVE